MANRFAFLIAEERMFAQDLEEMALVVGMEEHNRRWREERERDRQQPTRVEGYFNLTVPLYNNVEFKSHFKVERISFEVSM